MRTILCFTDLERRNRSLKRRCDRLDAQLTKLRQSYQNRQDECHRLAATVAELRGRILELEEKQ